MATALRWRPTPPTRVIVWLAPLVLTACPYEPVLPSSPGTETPTGDVPGVSQPWADAESAASPAADAAPDDTAVPPGQTAEGCGDTSRDPRNCGRCGHDCTILSHVRSADSIGCQGGRCLIPPQACDPGWAQCEADSAGGCETSLLRAESCGACAAACIDPAPQCALIAGEARCVSICPAPTSTKCGGRCVDLQTDIESCGRCENACRFAHGSARCIGGRCQLQTCQPGFGDCNGDPSDGCEASLAAAASCGSCNRACTGATEICLAAGGAGQCVNPGAALERLRWELPCGMVNADGEVCADLPPGISSCPAEGHHPLERAVTFGGQPGTRYEVTLRFRGVVEPRVYTGGMWGGDNFYIGGAPTSSGYNTYALTVSSPARVYYVNAVKDPPGESRRVFTVDYSKTVQIDGGASVKLDIRDPDCVQIRNCMDVSAATCRPYLVPGIPPAPQAYNGQFVQIDVVTIKSLGTQGGTTRSR